MSVSEQWLSFRRCHFMKNDNKISVKSTAQNAGGDLEVHLKSGGEINSLK